MRYFFIVSAVGVFLAALLLILFFKAGKKNKKQRRADRELVLNCGDESLIRLFEQAESDNERDGILEFVKEKLAARDSGGTASLDIMPAGSLKPEDAQPTEPPNTMPETLSGIMPETFSETPPQTIPETMPQSLPDLPPAGLAPKSAISSDSQVPSSGFAEGKSQLGAGLAPRSAILNDSQLGEAKPGDGRRKITGLMAGGSEEMGESAPASAPAHDGQVETRELPLDKMDWAALEEELLKKREEEARIMAHNQLIQDVFSKIQRVESRVVGEKKENENRANTE